MNRMTNNNDADDTMHTTVVEHALVIHRSITACHACIARGDGVHALTAALMLPCYQAEFRTLARALTLAQQSELRTTLQALQEPA